MPISFIILISLALAWLGYETDWMRVRLLIGSIKPPRYYGRSEIHELAKRIDWTFKPYKGASHWEALAKEWLTPLTGWDWIFEHEHDLDNYHPTVELYFGNGYKQTFTLKKPELMKEIIKINTGKKYFRQLASK